MRRGGRAATVFPILRRGSWLALVGAFIAGLLASRVARADDPEMTASVDTQKLGVGDVLRLSLHIASSHQQPSRPQPGTVTGFTLLGTSNSPTQQVMITNGHMTSQRGLDVVWSLRADKVGSWPIGPITVQVGNATYRAGPIRVTVVPAGQGPPHPIANDPFDPFGGGGTPFDPFRSLLDSLNGPAPTMQGAPPDAKLALDAPRGPVAFLHATTDLTSAVVGQQVTVSLYIYIEAKQHDPGIVDVHEATAADFVKKTLFEDDAAEHPPSHASVGGRLYNVHLLRKWALFPIKAGDLTVTPMELTLQRTRATGDPSRKSEELTIHVTEPPTDQRPPGYLLGDVGKFTLTGEVTPRAIEQDDAVGVTLTLTGIGNLPAMITPPAQAGIEWLPPEVHEKMGGVEGDRFGGTRTFQYVVRIHKTGDVDLGTLHVPYWDPFANHYDAARAKLGVITVRPSDKPKAVADAPPDPFATLPEVRGDMGGTRASPGHLAEQHPALFWLALTASPLGFLAFTGISRTVRTVRERSAERAASPETDLRTKLRAADRSANGTDARAIAASTARAVEAATVAYADVHVRGARSGEAARRLVDAGVAADVAATIDGVLTECEAARFSPDEPDLAEAQARWTKAKGAIDSLRRAA